MSQNRGGEFKNQSEWYDWDRHINLVGNPELSEEKKKSVIQGLKFLRKELKEHFLKNNSPDHPIFKKIVERKYEGLIWLSRVMEHFKLLDCNYDILLDKIRSTEGCTREGLPFLEVAGAFHVAGFDIQFIREERSSSPDIMVTNRENKEKLFIEISKLEEREDRIKRKNFYDKMIEEIAFGQPGVPHGGKFLDLPDDEEAAALMTEIKNIKKLCSQERKLVILENEFADIGFAHPDLQSELEEWLEEKRYQFLQVWGPPLNFDETPRITGKKLKKKASQLPKDYPGLIYMPVRPEYFIQTDVLSEEILNELRRKVNELPHVLGLVVYAKIDMGVDFDGALFRGLNCYRTKTSCDNVRLDMLFVFNDKCNIPVLPDTLNKIYHTLHIFRVS